MQPIPSRTAPQPIPVILTPTPLWQHLAPTYQHQLAHVVATLIQRIRRSEAGKGRTRER